MARAGWVSGAAQAGGSSRRYELWLPPGLETGKALPLVMLLHGCTQDAKDMAAISGMNKVAEVNGFLAVYPEQTRMANVMKCWNWFNPKHQARDAGEPSILAAIVAKVCSTHTVDLDRVYVVGVSAGGAMACILGATYPDIFTAIGVLSGAEFKAATSVSSGLAAMAHGGPDPIQQGKLAFEAMRIGLSRRNRPCMPVIVFHGTEDAKVDPVNADQVITQWRKTNECLAARPLHSDVAIIENMMSGEVPDGYPYRTYIYTDVDGHLLMEKWIVQGLGHAWSGSPKAIKYGDPKGPDASAEIWRFFCEAGTKVRPSWRPGSSHQEPRETIK